MVEALDLNITDLCFPSPPGVISEYRVNLECYRDGKKIKLTKPKKNNFSVHDHTM